MPETMAGIHCHILLSGQDIAELQTNLTYVLDIYFGQMLTLLGKTADGKMEESYISTVSWIELGTRQRSNSDFPVRIPTRSQSSCLLDMFQNLHGRLCLACVTHGN